jgi:hypothetical protein
MNLREDTRVHRGEGGMPQGELNVMKTLMTSLLLAGTALMAAQTGNTPAPAANSSATTAPAKVKKHHHKSKTSSTPAAATKSAPASTTPAK